MLERQNLKLQMSQMGRILLMLRPKPVLSTIGVISKVHRSYGLLAKILLICKGQPMFVFEHDVKMAVYATWSFRLFCQEMFLTQMPLPTSSFSSQYHRYFLLTYRDLVWHRKQKQFFGNYPSCYYLPHCLRYFQRFHPLMCPQTCNELFTTW